MTSCCDINYELQLLQIIIVSTVLRTHTITNDRITQYSKIMASSDNHNYSTINKAYSFSDDNIMQFAKIIINNNNETCSIYGENYCNIHYRGDIKIVDIEHDIGASSDITSIPADFFKEFANNILNNHEFNQ